MNKTARKKSMLCLLLAMLLVLPTAIAGASPESTTPPETEVNQDQPATPLAPSPHITEVQFSYFYYEIGKFAKSVGTSTQTDHLDMGGKEIFRQDRSSGNSVKLNDTDTLQANTEYLLKIWFTAKSGFDFDGLKKENITLDGKPAIGYDPAKKVATFALPVLRQTWTLTFNTTGGDPLDPIEDQENGTVVPLVHEIPTRSGFTFEGWYTEPEFTHKVTSITLTENKTVYAKWTANPARPVPQPPVPSLPAPGGNYVPDLGRTPERMEIPSQNGRENGYVQAPAGSVDPSTRLHITEKADGKRDIILVDANGNQIYSSELMLVTIPAPKGQQSPYRVKVNGVYTTFELSEDGKYVTMPVVFSRDGKMSEDVIVRQGGVSVTGTYNALPGMYKLSVTDRGNARYSLELTDASGKKLRSNGPVMVSIPAPQGVGEVYRVKVDGKWTTFEVKDGFVRFAMVF